MRKSKRKNKFLIFAVFIVLLVCSALWFANEKGIGFTQTGQILISSGKYSNSSDSWELVLVNSENPVPKEWKTELTTLSNGEKVDSRIYPYLQKMFDDMRAQGIYPIVRAGYRTSSEQQRLMDDKIAALKKKGYSDSKAKKEAKKWVAPVGTSEHELGISVDINADSDKSENDEVYNWLAANAYKYGFIRRYPPDKVKITGIDNEPWHYRYVGEAAAKEIYEKGECLEEYLK